MSTVIIAGLGGLGCPVALALAEAGVQRLVLVDDDVIDLSNLQRQVLYTAADVGRPKVEVAAARLRAIAPGIALALHRARFTAANADALLADADLIVDATDDPAARFVINDRALAHGVPAVLGGVQRYSGLVLAVGPGFGPCFRCLFEDAPSPGEVATCADAGVLAALPGVIGHLQAERALGLLAGDPARHTGFVTTVDGLAGRIRHVPLPDAADCPACGGVARLDLRAASAPDAVAHAELALAAVDAGGLLDLLVPSGPPARDLLDLLVRDGHAVLCQGGVAPDLTRAVVRRATQLAQPRRPTMAVQIKIPASLRKFVGGNDVVAVEGANVREVLDQLDSGHPGIKAKLCDDSGNVRRFINIYANSEDIRFLDNLDTALGDGAEVQIVPAIAGGWF